MNKEQWLSLLRNIFIWLGGILIGHYVLGNPVDTAWWEWFSGGVLVLVGGIWSWVDKQLDAEKKFALMRNAVAFIGAVLAAGGYIKDSIVQQVLGLITAIAPFIMQNILRGKIREY